MTGNQSMKSHILLEKIGKQSKNTWTETQSYFVKAENAVLWTFTPVLSLTALKMARTQWQ